MGYIYLGSSYLESSVNVSLFRIFSGDPANRLWVRAEVQLNSGSAFRVGFEGVVGGDDKTDIALDDISFSAGCYKVSSITQVARCKHL